jgi:hypothetical protein
MVAGVAAGTEAPTGWVPAATVREAAAVVLTVAPGPMVLPPAFTATTRYQ